MQLWESVGKMSKLQVFDIFWDILNKMKDNFRQERVKGGFYPFREKLEQLPLISLEE